MSSPTGDPRSEDTSDVDPVEVARDERLTEEVRSGTAAEAFWVAAELARFRDAVGKDLPRYSDPATSVLPHALYSDPRHNPIAFLPVPPDDNGREWVPPRVDDWCEDRSPDELSDDDGWD